MTEKEMIEEMNKRYIVLTEEEYGYRLSQERKECFYAGEKDMEAHYETKVLPKARKETAREIIGIIKTFSNDKNLTRIIAERYGVDYGIEVNVDYEIEVNGVKYRRVEE